MRHFVPNPICVNGSAYFHTFQYSGVFTGILERINSFVSNAPFLYPMNISENRKSENEWNGTKWVKISFIKWKTSLLCKKNFILPIITPCIEAPQIFASCTYAPVISFLQYSGPINKLNQSLTYKTNVKFNHQTLYFAGTLLIYAICFQSAITEDVCFYCSIRFFNHIFTRRFESDL